MPGLPSAVAEQCRQVLTIREATATAAARAARAAAALAADVFEVACKVWLEAAEGCGTSQDAGRVME